MTGAPPRPTLLLLHAFGSAGRAYGPLANALAPVATVLAPDLPGFGDTPSLPAPSVAAYADWVEAGVGRAAEGSILLGGWSMGGKIAFALAARRPAWLKGLALIAPSPPSPEPIADADRKAQLDGFGDAVLARRSVEELIVGPAPAAWIDAAVQDRLATAEDAWRWWLDAGSREDLAAGSPLETPALVVVGAQDLNLGEAVQRRETVPRLARATVSVLENCGHFAPLEQPAALAETVEAWVRGL